MHDAAFSKSAKELKKIPSDFLFGQQRATERNKKDVAIILCRDAGNHAFEKKARKKVEINLARDQPPNLCFSSFSPLV